MRNIAIVYATKGGQTEKIVERMQASLEAGGCVVETWNAQKVNFDLGSQIDGVLIGGPVYAGQFPRSIVRWVKKNKARLAEKRTGYFTVSLNAADKRREARKADDDLLRLLITKTGFVPDFVASVAGALKYQDYFPPLRWQMRRIAERAKGDTDTSRNHEYTDWNLVRSFCDAFRENDRVSTFAVTQRLQSDLILHRSMKVFEHYYSSAVLVNASPLETYDAFSSVPSQELKTADLLATIRSLGMTEHINETFVRSSERFGVIPLVDDPGVEVAGGLVGKFWRLGFSIQRLDRNEFQNFDRPGFTKVVTRFTFTPEESRRTRFNVTMRIHSTDASATRKFGIYWTALLPGIHLYMRSILRGVKRRAEMEHAVESLLQTRPEEEIT